MAKYSRQVNIAWIYQGAYTGCRAELFTLDDAAQEIDRIRVAHIGCQRTCLARTEWIQIQVFKGKIGLEEQRWEEIQHCFPGQLIVGYRVLFRFAILDRTAARNQIVLVDELLYGSPDRLSADMRQGILELLTNPIKFFV